jgi:hypothetical protein
VSSTGHFNVVLESPAEPTYPSAGLLVYPVGMIAMPSNNVFDTALRLHDKIDNSAELRRLAAFEQAMDSEDYRTVHTDRGPVRGWSGGFPSR